MFSFRFVAIRDDDICRFTSVDRFLKVHRFLLKEKIPFTVSVIPEVSDSASYQPNLIERFIPSSLAGKGKVYPIAENQSLVDCIREYDFIEIAQHGFTHEVMNPFLPEFVCDDREQIVFRLEKGKSYLAEVFGQPPHFFVPPYDQVSAVALQEIRLRFLGISLSQISHRLLPWYLWPQFKWKKWQGKFLLNWQQFMILQHPGIDLSLSEKEWSPLRVQLQAVRDVWVIPLHSWKFFDTQGSLLSHRLAQWENLLKCLYQENVQFVRFSDLWRQKHEIVLQDET